MSSLPFSSTKFEESELCPLNRGFRLNNANVYSKHANLPNGRFLLGCNYSFNEKNAYRNIRPLLNLINSFYETLDISDSVRLVESFEIMLSVIKYDDLSKNYSATIFDQLKNQIDVISRNQSEQVLDLLTIIKKYIQFLEFYKKTSQEKTNFSKFWNHYKHNVENAVLEIIANNQAVERKRLETADTVAVQPVAPVLEFEERILNDYNEIRRTNRSLPEIAELIKSSSIFSEKAISQILEFQTYFEDYPNSSKKIAKDLKARLTLLKFFNKNAPLLDKVLSNQIQIGYTFPDGFIDLLLFQELNNILKSLKCPLIDPENFMRLKNQINIDADPTLVDKFIQISFNIAKRLFDINSKYKNLDLVDLVQDLNNYIQRTLKTQRIQARTRQSVARNERKGAYPLAPDAARYPGQIVGQSLARSTSANVVPASENIEDQTNFQVARTETLPAEFRPIKPIPPYLHGENFQILPHEPSLVRVEDFLDFYPQVIRGNGCEENMIIPSVLETIGEARESVGEYQVTRGLPSTPSPINMESQLSSTAPDAEGGVHYTDIEEALGVISSAKEAYEKAKNADDDVSLLSEILNLLTDQIIDNVFGGNLERLARAKGLGRHIVDRVGATSDANEALDDYMAVRESGGAIATKKAEIRLIEAKARRGGPEWVAAQEIKEVTKQGLIENVARIFGILFRK